VPEVTTIVLVPRVAAGSIFKAAVALVGEFTVKAVTVIPTPTLAVVVPWLQCVNCPVKLTNRFCCPAWPVAGLADSSAGGCWKTVNAFARVATSAPVVTETVRGPVDAAGSMFNRTVAVVGEVTVSDVTVVPAPKLAVVVPCTQCVN